MYIDVVDSWTMLFPFHCDVRDAKEIHYYYIPGCGNSIISKFHRSGIYLTKNCGKVLIDSLCYFHIVFLWVLLLLRIFILEENEGNVCNTLVILGSNVMNFWHFPVWKIVFKSTFIVLFTLNNMAVFLDEHRPPGTLQHVMSRLLSTYKLYYF